MDFFRQYKAGSENNVSIIDCDKQWITQLKTLNIFATVSGLLFLSLFVHSDVSDSFFPVLRSAEGWNAIQPLAKSNHRSL